MLFVSDSTDCLFVSYLLFVLFTAVFVVIVVFGVLGAFVNCYSTVVSRIVSSLSHIIGIYKNLV